MSLNKIIPFALLAIALIGCENKNNTDSNALQWAEVSISEETDFTNISFIDDKTGYALGVPKYDSIFVEYELTIDVNEFDNYANPIFTDTNEYYNFKISRTVPLDLGPSLYTTNDGGLSWQEVSSEIFYKPLDFQFVDKNNGFILTEDGVYSTSNGGRNWNRILVNIYFERDGNLTPIDFPFEKIHFFNSKEGIVYSEDFKIIDIAIHTSDGGQTWDIISSENSDVQFNVGEKVVLLDNHNSGILVNLRTGQTFETENAGASWDLQEEKYDYLTDIDYWDANSGAYVDGNHRIYTSSNGGTDWKQSDYMHTPPYCNKLMYINDSTICSVTLNSINNSSDISFDKGITFTPIGGLPEDIMIKQIVFTKSETGYLIGSDGKIYQLSL